MGLLIFIGIVWLIIDILKAASEPTIPAENWKNVGKTWDVFDLDAKEFQKNLRNGKYKEEGYKMLEILFIVVLVILFNIPKWKFNNYTPPTGQKIDYNAQALDRVRNNLTNEQVMRNTINGKYNVKR